MLTKYFLVSMLETVALPNFFVDTVIHFLPFFDEKKSIYLTFSINRFDQLNAFLLNKNINLL